MNPKEALIKALSEVSSEDFAEYAQYTKSIHDLSNVLDQDADIIHIMLLGAIGHELDRLSKFHAENQRIKKQVTYLKLLKSKIEQINDLLIFT